MCSGVMWVSGYRVGAGTPKYRRAAVSPTDAAARSTVTCRPSAGSELTRRDAGVTRAFVLPALYCMEGRVGRESEVTMTGGIKNIILVASGKGGVGKSTVAVNLSLALAARKAQVGLLDADVYGPSIPTMLGHAEPRQAEDGKRLKAIAKHGIELMSIGYLVDPNTAMIWRGPMLASAVTQFVTDVEWGELDYLVMDLPPGTGDIQLTLAQKFKVTGAVLVTTPQVVALSDVIRAKSMFDKVRIRTLGLVENMSYFICPTCDSRHEIFSHGGGESAAADLDIPFLGRIPIETAVREASDTGLPIVLKAPEAASAKAFFAIADTLQVAVQKINADDAVRERRQGALKIVSN
ncbi:MAG: Mrp/NBP35 family ATP-binding protein [Deltaproteobacteria bacterium]|nr:Mrp/NBP35 family ATP-binding protein [Deltaproteobacteria bacterium]